MIKVRNSCHGFNSFPYLLASDTKSLMDPECNTRLLINGTLVIPFSRNMPLLGMKTSNSAKFKVIAGTGSKIPLMFITWFLDSCIPPTEGTVYINVSDSVCILHTEKSSCIFTECSGSCFKCLSGQ